MIPDISYLILNYNPEGELHAQEILNQTIATFYSRKSKSLTCDVFLLDQGSTAAHRRNDLLSFDNLVVKFFIFLRCRIPSMSFSGFSGLNANPFL